MYLVNQGSIKCLSIKYVKRCQRQDIHKYFRHLTPPRALCLVILSPASASQRFVYFAGKKMVYLFRFRAIIFCEWLYRDGALNLIVFCTH